MYYDGQPLINHSFSLFPSLSLIYCLKSLVKVVYSYMYFSSDHIEKKMRKSSNICTKIFNILQCYEWITFLYTAAIRADRILIPSVIPMWKFWWKNVDCKRAMRKNPRAYTYPFHSYSFLLVFLFSTYPINTLQNKTSN